MIEDMRRRPGKSMMPQALRCMRDQHDWTARGNYIPAPINYDNFITVRPRDVAPEPTRIEAYRWRRCICGAAERESYADHTIKRFNPGDTDDA